MMTCDCSEGFVDVYDATGKHIVEYIVVRNPGSHDCALIPEALTIASHAGSREKDKSWDSRFFITMARLYADRMRASAENVE